MKIKLCLFLFCFWAQLAAIGQGEASINGQLVNSKTDTIKVVVTENSIVRKSSVYLVPVTDGKFKLTIRIEKPTFLYATDGTNYVNGLIEKGDHVALKYDADNFDKSIQFTGRGGQKFTFHNYFVKYQLYKKVKEHVLIAKQNRFPFDEMFLFIDSTANIIRKKLDTIKPFLSYKSLKIFKSEIRAAVMGNKYRSIGMVYHESVDETLQKRSKELTPTSKQYLLQILNFDNTLSYSEAYINEVYNVLFTYYDGLVLSGKADKDILKKYKYLANILPSTLKIPVLTLFLESDVEKLNQGEDLDFIITQVFSSSKASIYSAFIRNRYKQVTSFKKGIAAPDFNLQNVHGETVNLATFQGKVIYLDFWYAACGPCHALFKNLEVVKENFDKADPDVVFLCISIDKKEAWKSALTKYDIKGYHVYTGDNESNHPIIREYKVAGYPTTCLIDKNGRIFSATPSNNPTELIKQIEDALKIPSNYR